MKNRILILSFLFLFSAVFSYAQTPQVLPAAPPVSNDPTLLQISGDLSQISKSIAEFNKKLTKFFETFSSNQGLKLTDKQQKLLIAFEILNRAEQRLSTLTKLRIELNEKQSETKIKLAGIEDALREENVERNVAMRGTTNGNEVRENRRSTLQTEKFNVRNLLNEIQTSLFETNDEIRQTEYLIKSVRPKLFSEIEKELSDF